jgi:hypothetical protein
MLGGMHDRTGMVLASKVAKAGNTRRAHRRCMHGLRTEGELPRNALGCSHIITDRDKLVMIIHAMKSVCCSPKACVGPQKNRALKNQVFPADQVLSHKILLR